MNTSHQGTEPPENGPRAWWNHEELQRSRLQVQVASILEHLEGAAAWPPENSGELDYLYRAGRILVRDADVRRVLGRVGGSVVDAVINGVSAIEPGDGDTQFALSTIDEEFGVGVATPDHVLYIAPAGCCPATEPEPVTQNKPDPEVRRDPGLDGSGTLVSVVDTGYIAALSNAQHGWLADVTGDQESFDETHLVPYVGHGSFVTGVLRCMAPRAEVRVEGFLARAGAIFEYDIVKQLHEAMDSMPDIISMSAGCTTRRETGLLTFEAFWANRLSRYKGTVLVAAAGNDGSRRAFFPAAYNWTVSVGALDRDGRRAPFSNYGSWVDVYALGRDVINAFPNGTYYYQEPPKAGQSVQFVNEMARWSGTSFATPLVAGMIAARMSRTGQSGRAAADSVLRIARAHARAGVGAIAEPGMAGDRDPGGPA